MLLRSCPFPPPPAFIASVQALRNLPENPNPTSFRRSPSSLRASSQFDLSIMVSSGAKQLSVSSCSSSRRSKRRLHRFLKPGDLARLRDSIIRTLRSDAPLLLSPPSSPSPAAQIDGRPCFVARGHGPRYPQRRKLVAAKCVFFAPPSPDPEHFFDPFGVDLVPAH